MLLANQPDCLVILAQIMFNESPRNLESSLE
jgi:hypothetical protein